MYVVVLASQGCDDLAEVKKYKGTRKVLMYTRGVERLVRGLARSIDEEVVLVKVSDFGEENMLKLYVMYPPELVLNCDCSFKFTGYTELVRSSGVEEVNICLDKT
ncbi:hypothetical protein [Thermogladius sp.]|uniref:hypothetical protein n=1 Tax=Thermogladius sp. TaxID=2023064 RepID=UPI003D11F9F0